MTYRKAVCPTRSAVDFIMLRVYKVQEIKSATAFDEDLPILDRSLTAVFMTAIWTLWSRTKWSRKIPSQVKTALGKYVHPHNFVTGRILSATKRNNDEMINGHI